MRNDIDYEALNKRNVTTILAMKSDKKNRIQIALKLPGESPNFSPLYCALERTYHCRNIGKNAKCENELKRRLPETAVCRVQRCADLRLAISINGGVLKHKIQVYNFRTLTGGPSVKSRQPMNQH